MACHQSVHFQVQLLLPRPKKDWNQTEHCSNYQLQNRRENVKIILLKQICRLSESKQIKILTCGRTLCPWITVRFFTMDWLWPGFFGLWFGLSKPLLLQNLLLFFPQIFLLDKFSSSLLFFFPYSVLLSFATEKQTQHYIQHIIVFLILKIKRSILFHMLLPSFVSFLFNFSLQLLFPNPSLLSFALLFQKEGGTFFRKLIFCFLFILQNSQGREF